MCRLILHEALSGAWVKVKTTVTKSAILCSRPSGKSKQKNNNKNKNNWSILRNSTRWRVLFLRKFLPVFELCKRFAIPDWKNVPDITTKNTFPKFFSMCLGNIQYPWLKLRSVHNVNLNWLAKQSGARSFKVLYMKINTKVDRKPVRFFSNSVNLDSKSSSKWNLNDRTLGVITSQNNDLQDEIRYFVRSIYRTNQLNL